MDPNDVLAIISGVLMAIGVIVVGLLTIVGAAVVLNALHR